MDADHTAAHQAIQSARQAIQNGDRHTARRMAQQAVLKASDLDESWLVMAELASPHARLYYLDQAHKVNSVDRTPETFKKFHPWISALGFCLILALGMLAWFAWQGKISGAQGGMALASLHFPGRTTESMVTPTASSAAFVPPAPVYVATATPTIPSTSTPTLPPTAILTPVGTQTPTQSPTQKIDLSPGKTATPAKEVHAQNIYTVKRGETLEKVAEKFGCDLDELMQVNHIEDASTVRRGIRLVIPKDSSGAGAQNQGKAAPAAPRKSGKSILIDISQQHLFAYDGKKLALSFDVSTGRNGSTATGTFSILDKIPNAWSDPWGFWMPHWMGIYYVGSNLENGFHSLPVLTNGQEIWGDEIGVPITYGCVVLGPGAMKRLYTWSEIGTPVFIQR